ncbi:Exo-poly-alpha-D-galacturonosidase [Alteracholeplasma palmae J233]|uniref:Exo-poly-alpha-D-galacturonosidase n=1 Tax=Alteracholeplasma palmae (strain ATCC 49389 / J233) TaxID=1318466 RepID=U4KSF4_ALTPJ|nr:glycosyl hydrolase family 28 protein [Alteracholeplasma palmae]CCV64961.1 Exo-poly-alpha-D-galacturonosidase [Alteracholeplasma palmae J233]
MKSFRTHLIDKTGTKDVTKELQELIIKTSQAKGKLILETGVYLTSALYLESDMEFHFEDNATLLGTTDETAYKLEKTRVAGIEMDWYPGILNCKNKENVVISGNGFIDGQGEYFWNKYWGSDTKSGMRKEYDAKGLRWACDYDCLRVRNVVVSNSKNIVLKEFSSKKSGFWNVHVLYSEHIHIDGVKILSSELHSPSTDGIDIDSSSHVLIENCVTSCNDDSICIKSGRDYDGIRVARPSHDIIIRNCEILSGFGVTLGSEVSGGIYNIKIENLKYHGTDCGFRIKSSINRKGYIKDIFINNLEMINVKYLFHIYLNWNPDYSICEIPKDYKGNIKEHWKVLTQKIDPSISNTIVENIYIKNIKATNEPNYKGISRAFHIEGFKDVPIKNLVFENMNLNVAEYGVINYVKELQFKDTQITVSSKADKKNDDYDNR